MTKTAVVGAGYLGRAVAAALTGEVITTTRSGSPTGLEPAIPNHTLDVLTDPPTEIASTVAGCDSVVVCFAPGPSKRSNSRSSGSASSPSATPASDSPHWEERRALYVYGSRRLLGALGDQALRRVVFTSSTSALPDVDGWVDETCETWPGSPRGRIQREAEQMVVETCEEAGWPWTILRLGGLYGPGRAIGSRFAGSEIPSDGLAPTNLVHRDDAVAAVLAALHLPPSVSTLVHVCADDHRPRREIYAAAAAARGEPAPTWADPAAPGARPTGKRVANDRMKRLLGVQLRHPAHAV